MKMKNPLQLWLSSSLHLILISSVTDGNRCLDFQLIESSIEIKLLLLVGLRDLQSADKNTKLLDFKFHFLRFAWRVVITVDILLYFWKWTLCDKFEISFIEKNLFSVFISDFLRYRDYSMENARVRFLFTSWVFSQKTNEWAQRTSEFSDTTQRVNKKSYKAFSMV